MIGQPFLAAHLSSDIDIDKYQGDDFTSGCTTLCQPDKNTLKEPILLVDNTKLNKLFAVL